MVDTSLTGMRCRATKDIRSHRGLVRRCSEGIILPILFNFLMPLHVMAEIGGLSVTLRYSPIRADQREEQYTEWSLDLQGVLGRSVTVHWSSARRWKGSRVIYERHYDHHHQIRGPLTFIDLGLDESPRQHANTKPS